MLNDVTGFLSSAFETHRGRKIGFIIGFLFGFSILFLGFFKTMFLLICGTLGLCIGAKLDDHDELVDHTISFLDKILPRKFQRW